MRLEKKVVKRLFPNLLLQEGEEGLILPSSQRATVFYSATACRYMQTEMYSLTPLYIYFSTCLTTHQLIYFCTQPAIVPIHDSLTKVIKWHREAHRQLHHLFVQTGSCRQLCPTGRSIIYQPKLTSRGQVSLQDKCSVFLLAKHLGRSRYSDAPAHLKLGLSALWISSGMSGVHPSNTFLMGKSGQQLDT